MTYSPLTDAPAWTDFDAAGVGFEFEHGVGLSIAKTVGSPLGIGRWLSWDETVALHRWLGEKMEQGAP